MPARLRGQLARLPLLFFQIRDNSTLELRRDDVNIDGSRLPEPPAAPDRLVELLERVRYAAERDLADLLEVQSKTADRALADEHTSVATKEPLDAALLLVVGLRAGDLDRAGYGRRECS